MKIRNLTLLRFQGIEEQNMTAISDIKIAKTGKSLQKALLL
jgi:hypothetical protein